MTLPTDFDREADLRHLERREADESRAERAFEERRFWPVESWLGIPPALGEKVEHDG